LRDARDHRHARQRVEIPGRAVEDRLNQKREVAGRSVDRVPAERQYQRREIDRPQEELAKQPRKRHVGAAEQHRRQRAQRLRNHGGEGGEHERVPDDEREAVGAKQAPEIAQRQLLAGIVERTIQERLIENGQERRCDQDDCQQRHAVLDDGIAAGQRLRQSVRGRRPQRAACVKRH
jgi:hypothetical protein